MTIHLIDKLSLSCLTVLICHQVDAAYWHEWEMFSMPGGIQLFNAINLAAFTTLLWGFVKVVQRRPSGYIWAWVIASITSLIFFFHLGFALFGFRQFNLPLSIALIVASLPLSLWLAILTLRNRDLFFIPKTE